MPRIAPFDAWLAVTTICFVDDARRMLFEARRVLRPGGQLDDVLARSTSTDRERRLDG